MKHLEHRLVGHQAEKRADIDAVRQHVDARRFLRPAELDQAKLGPVRLVAHEFGVDRNEVGGRQEAARVDGQATEIS